MKAGVEIHAALAVVAALAVGCTLNLGDKTCETSADCLGGDLCIEHRCARGDGGGGSGGAGSGASGGRGGGGGAGRGGGSGGNASGGGPGSIDAGADVGPPRMCPAEPVTACPPGAAGNGCADVVCGGRLWQDGVLPSMRVLYRILDPQGMFSASYRNAIRAGAAAWNAASAGFLTFQECLVCSGRFISVVPGDDDGVLNPDEPEQRLPMPVVPSGGRISPHWIAHQWGHVAGLSHTYERPDRDRYTRFDPEVWCAAGGSGLPPRCVAGTGSAGVFDETSKMNRSSAQGICGGGEPDADSSEPTIADVSAVAELFFAAAAKWSPFQPIGRSLSPTQPLDYQLAPGVDPTGSPAIAEVTYASPEIFVRGTDDRVYTTTRADPSSSAPGWLDWKPLADDVDADPAAVFAVNATPSALFLAVRSRVDGRIYLSARRDGAWRAWTPLGAPPVGAASGPALASESPTSLAVLVRGGDGLIYRLACDDAVQDCAGSGARANAWSALPPPPSGIFVGNPSAVWMRDATGLTVAAMRDDRVAMVITRVNTGGSDWLSADNLNPELAADDPDPGLAITLTSVPGDVAFFARTARRLLVSDTLQAKYFPLGGVLASPPAAVAMYHGAIRTDVAAIIDDHGHPGVWWRYNDDGYAAPCRDVRPGACGPCGP